MPLRQLLVTRDRQPQEAVGIDWTNPLTKGLIFLAIPGGPDLVSGTHPLPIGSSDVKTGPDGLVLDSPSTTTGGWYWPLPASHPLYSVTTEVSLFLRSRITTTSAYNAQLCVPYRSGSWTPPYTSLDMCANDGGRKGRLAFATGGSIHEAAASKSTFLDPGGVKSYAVTKAGTAVLWYLDGQQDDSGTASSGGSIDWNTKQPLCLFNHSNSSTGEGMVASASIAIAYNRPLSAAEVAALHANPWQLFEPQRIYLPTSSAAGINVGRADETSTALALSAMQLRAAGRADKVDTALSLQPVAALPTGLAAETGAALALAPLQLLQATAASEADTALALQSGLSGSVGLAEEADAALGLAPLQLFQVQVAAESDEAVALAGRQLLPAGDAAEVGAALPLAALQSQSVGLASETDAAQALALYEPGAIGLAAESDTALALACVQILGTGSAESTEAALALAAALVGTVGVAVDSEAAQALSVRQLRAVAIAGEAGLAFALDATTPGACATAADVWSHTLANGLSAEQTLLETHAYVLALARIHGLVLGESLLVTAGSRQAGPIEQTITQAGDQVTVTRVS